MRTLERHGSIAEWRAGSVEGEQTSDSARRASSMVASSIWSPSRDASVRTYGRRVEINGPTDMGHYYTGSYDECHTNGGTEFGSCG